ncbi:helix-turn-helix domain-containing protein [Hoeflea prorocentri]|uniref:AraC family transcriptional regulator n=1 Tax=Hoeflea prorocentri TaxID=1922333 RepID=A0A9X3UM26_9HYPH|nr:AraC family transcriptional regulator [Hoeflea prorocentri]MCY6381561.1 AraC family transcriptional regulator [Hoeflea prorocentri]MDA5399361.1 AraC family transcriptional regulator [Hoeflea prorocentri]
MENATSLPSLRLDAEMVGARHCYDAWRETVRCVYDVNPLNDGTSTTERLEAWLLDNLIFSETAFSEQTFAHNARHAEDSNYLTLQIYKSGGSKGVFGNRDWQMEPGEVHIYDFSREFHSVAQNSVVAGVTLPHSAIGYDPGKHPAHMSYGANSPIGQLLKNAVFLMQKQAPDVKPDEAPELARVFCGMLSGLILPQTEERDTKATKSRAERHADMRAYLERNLGDPTLGIEHLLRTFAVSRPAIYRDFADVGGVAAYINKRRLDRAFHQLLSASAKATRVKDVANQLGFQDPAYFSRLFRQRFGISPVGALNSRGISTPYASQGDASDNQFAVRDLSNWFNTI